MNVKVIRIEVDTDKKEIIKINVSKTMNPIAAAIVLNQVACIQLATIEKNPSVAEAMVLDRVACKLLGPVQIKPRSNIIVPKLKMVSEGASKV